MEIQSGSSSDYYHQVTDLFSQTNIVYLFAFLVAYGIIYAFVSLFHNDHGNPANSQLFLSRSIDFVILTLALFIGGAYFYTNVIQNPNTTIMGWFFQWSKDFFNDPNLLVEKNQKMHFILCYIVFRI